MNISILKYFKIDILIFCYIKKQKTYFMYLNKYIY